MGSDFVTRLRRTSVVGIVAALAGFGRGCIPAVDTPSCVVRCVDSCLPGLECRAGFCVRRGFSGVCPVTPAPLPDAGEPDAAAPAADGGLDASDGYREDPCAISSSGLRVEPCPIPSPCTGVAYEQRLAASGGVEPYTWSGVLPDGLALSPEGVISGEPLASGVLSIDVVDASGARKSQRYDVATRDSCWFAYVAVGQDGAALQLFDPVLSSPSAGVQLPRAPATGSVQDFAFSTDGRMLAVRLRDEGSVDRLALFSAPRWEEQNVSLPGSVLQYAWSSPEVGVLAVAYRDGDATFLTGVRTNVAADAGSDAGVQTMEPVAAPVESELVWFAREWVAFHAAPDPMSPDDHSPFFTRLGPSGFISAEPLLSTSYTSSAELSPRLEPGPDGIFFIVSDGGFEPWITWFTPPGPEMRVQEHHPEVILSPAHDFAARAIEGSLQVFRSGEIERDPVDRLYPLALTTSGGCSRFLAWAPLADRAACAVDGEGGGISVLTFTDGSATVSPVEGDYDYGSAPAAFRRRSFSPRGARLAFTTDAALYIARAEPTGRYVVDRPALPLIPAENRVAEITFAPNERLFLRRQGTRLWLHDAEANQIVASLSDSTTSSLPCTETEGALSQDWCGTSQPNREVQWSSDSRAAAYRSDARSLVVLKPERPDPPMQVTCRTSCGSFAFQPQPAP